MAKVLKYAKQPDYGLDYLIKKCAILKSSRLPKEKRKVGGRKKQTRRECIHAGNIVRWIEEMPFYISCLFEWMCVIINRFRNGILMHMKSTFIDYYYYYIADAVEICHRESIKTRKRERNVILYVHSVSLFNESTENIVWILKCQKLFMKLSFNEKCENDLSERLQWRRRCWWCEEWNVKLLCGNCMCALILLLTHLFK